MPADDEATVDALLDAVFAQPDDPAPKLVYADYLIERGDARGELIALQLANDPAAAERIDALVSRNGAAWTGPLGAWFRKPVFVDGFFAGGQWTGAQPRFDEIPPHILRQWRLVRTVRSYFVSDGFAAAGATVAFADGPHLSGVRTLELWRPGLTVLEDLAEGAVRGFDTLTIDDPLDLPAQYPSLPKLRTLGFVVAPERTRAHLEYAAGVAGVDAVEVTNVRRWVQRYTRATPGGPFSHLAVRCHVGGGMRTKEWTALLLQLVAQLPDTLERVAILGRKRQIAVASQVAIERELRRIAKHWTVPW